MSDNAVKSNGITVEWSSDGGSTYNTIGEIKDTEMPGGGEASEHETSDHASNYKTFVGGMIDGGEFSSELNVIPGNAQHAALRAAVGDTIDVRVTLPTAVTTNNQLTFSGPLKTFGPFSAPVDGIMTGPFSVKISGSWTWATA